MHFIEKSPLLCYEDCEKKLVSFVFGILQLISDINVLHIVILALYKCLQRGQNSVDVVSNILISGI